MYNEYGSEKQPSSHDPDHDKKKDKHKEPVSIISFINSREAIAAIIGDIVVVTIQRI